MELDIGLIIGRADKCHDGGIRAVLNEWVSRAHLLILREGTASTHRSLLDERYLQNGTRVRHLTLPDTGTSLRLGSTSGVGLLWHPRGPHQDSEADASRIERRGALRALLGRALASTKHRCNGTRFSSSSRSRATRREYGAVV